MYTAGREQVRERHSRCTQQGREMHRMRRGAAQGKYQKASTKFNNKRIRNNKNSSFEHLSLFNTGNQEEN